MRTGGEVDRREVHEDICGVVLRSLSFRSLQDRRLLVKTAVVSAGANGISWY